MHGIYNIVGFKDSQENDFISIQILWYSTHEISN